MDYLGEDGDNIIKEYYNQVVGGGASNNKVSLEQWVVARAKQRGYKIAPVKVCKECGDNLITTSEGNTVCSSCGVEATVISLVDCYTRSPTPYKRLTHFKDWLLKSQAKHTVEFPEGLIDIIKTRCASGGYSYHNIRGFLKRRCLFRHYEDIALIQDRLGRDNLILKLTPNEELLLQNYFCKVAQVYNQFKLKKRKSFLSYSFIIRELIKLFFSVERASELNLDFFCLPKAEKVVEYSVVFSKIKQYYKW